MELHKLDTETQVFFYEQDFYVLSNFSSFEVTFNGEDYKTAEHAYQCQKFFVAAAGYHDIRKDIREARSAHGAFKIAQQHKHLQRVDWDEVKVNVMCEILREKVKQHAYVMWKLLATGDRELIEDSWRDSFWGCGEDRQGLNMLGKCWMRVRDDLRREFILKHSREAFEREFQNVWGQKKEVGKDSVLNRLHSTHIEDGLIGQTIREAVSDGNTVAAEELTRSLLGSEESPRWSDLKIKEALHRFNLGCLSGREDWSVFDGIPDVQAIQVLYPHIHRLPGVTEEEYKRSLVVLFGPLPEDVDPLHR